MFIQTEETPNPNALKFYPNQVINEGEPVHYFEVEDCINSDLARKLFEIDGVQGVFFGYDFITLTKKDDEQWELLKPEALVIIMDHLVAGMPVFNTDIRQVSDIDYDTLSEIEKQIVEIIETRVSPAVAQDGGNIVYKGFENGVVRLELRGSCSGCPSSSITLKNGIESMLRHYVPEVESVEAVNS
jgi:Fe-S cluster biogenesis protein NfuA